MPRGPPPFLLLQWAPDALLASRGGSQAVLLGPGSAAAAATGGATAALPAAAAAMVHRRHAHHAAASSRHQPSPTAAATAQSDASAGGELQLRAKLQQWQRVAKLTPQAAHQLLREQPHLRALLQSSELRPSNLLVNLACLSLRASELQAEQHTELRGLLALLPPSLLQESLGAEHSLLHRQLAWHRQGQQQQEQLSTAQRVRQLRDCLLQSLGPARMQPLAMVAQQQRGRPGPEQPAASALHPLYQSAPLQQQQQQEQHLLRPQLRRQQQQQHQHQHHSFSEQRQHPQQGWQGLAEVIVRAIGLHPSEPLDEHSLSRTVQAQLLRGRSSTSSSAGSSSTSGSEQLRGSSPSRAFASSAGLTVAQGLAHALEHTSRAGRLSGKPVHDADAAAQLAQQLQQVGGGDKHAVLQLLLRRPIVLWQHATPHPPGDVLAELQQLLPPLQQRNGVLQLVQQAPALLSCSREQLASAAELLLGRLQLSRPQLAGLVLRHPKLLLTAPKQMSANVGFLVALGLRPVELQAMALKEPRWLTTSLRDLSVQWHFTQQVLKGTLQDLVLFPQLLTLPVASRLGPRALYARKRHIRLLPPSALHGLVRKSAGKASQQAEWRRHRQVPMQFWLSVPDREMCAALDLNIDDFHRFKTAWQSVDGANWARLGLTGGPGAGGEQLQLSGQDAQW